MLKTPFVNCREWTERERGRVTTHDPVLSANRIRVGVNGSNRQRVGGPEFQELTEPPVRAAHKGGGARLKSLYLSKAEKQDRTTLRCGKEIGITSRAEGTATRQ